MLASECKLNKRISGSEKAHVSKAGNNLQPWTPINFLNYPSICNQLRQLQIQYLSFDKTEFAAGEIERMKKKSIERFYFYGTEEYRPCG